MSHVIMYACLDWQIFCSYAAKQNRKDWGECLKTGRTGCDPKENKMAHNETMMSMITLQFGEEKRLEKY